MALLLGVELLDELYSGVPSVGSADIQAAFEAPYELTAVALLLLPGLFALCVEPVLFLLADRHPRKWFVCGGLFAMGAAALLAAVAPNLYVLSAAIAVAWVGSGCAVALAQATLIDARPNDPERAMAEWTLFGEVGDLLAPALMAAIMAVSLDFRSAFVCVGVCVLIWGLVLCRRSFPDPPGAVDEPSGSDPEPTLLGALREAVTNRRLMFWLGATALCDLLDEIVIVFAALHLRDALEAGPVARSVVIGAGIVGSIGGVVATDRLLARMQPLSLLIASAATCSAVYVAWLFAPTIWLSAILFLLVGATAAPMYPIASAQAYRALPGRSGTVNAAGHCFTPLALAIPWGLGALADSVDVRAALAVLLVQPLGLLVLALTSSRHR